MVNQANRADSFPLFDATMEYLSSGNNTPIPSPFTRENILDHNTGPIIELFDNNIFTKADENSLVVFPRFFVKYHVYNRRYKIMTHGEECQS